MSKPRALLWDLEEGLLRALTRRRFTRKQTGRVQGLVAGDSHTYVYASTIPDCADTVGWYTHAYTHRDYIYSTYIYICMQPKNIHTYIHTHACVLACMHFYTHLYTFITCTHTDTCNYVHMELCEVMYTNRLIRWMSKSVHPYVYIYIHIHTYTIYVYNM